MTAYGYTSGDPRKVDIAGDTMTGPLILSEDPVVPMEAAPKQYVDAGGGGGGGGTPSNTVTAQTTYGAASTAGVATAYSRGDHAHGTPALPTPAAIGADPAGAAAAAQANAIAAIPGPSGTVVSETAFGQAAAAGVANTTSRGDHTHGTPAAPSIPSASGSVVSETAFGQAAAVGASAAYSRGDHTHGTPAAPTIPSASGTVAAETSYGISSSAGAAATFSRGDHTHGSPSLTANTPQALTITGVGAVGNGTAPARDNHVHAGPGFGNVTTETSFGQAANNGAAVTVARSDHTHGTPAAPASGSFKTVVQARLTSGNITAAAGPSFTTVGSDLTIPAAAGDILAVDIDALCDAGGIDCQFEACTRVSAANLNFWSSGNTVSLNPGGVATWYVFGGQFNGPRGRAYYTVQAGDIVAGNVTVRMLAFGAGGGRVINANTSYPLKWALSNVGA